MGKLSNLRHLAFVAQRGRCFYCSRPMWEHDPQQFAARHGVRQRVARHFQCTAEHLLARQDGGRDEACNIVAACRLCNARRHAGRSETAPTAEAYRARVQRRVAAGRWFPGGTPSLLLFCNTSAKTTHQVLPG